MSGLKCLSGKHQQWSVSRKIPNSIASRGRHQNYGLTVVSCHEQCFAHLPVVHSVGGEADGLHPLNSQY